MSERRYHYDALGRIGQIDDLLRGTTQYHYDPLSRLKSVQGPVPEQFIFDPASNLLGMLECGQSDCAGTPQSDSIAQPAKGNRLAMQGDQHFTYDLLGRRIEKRWGKGQRFKQIYRYNANSQLALVQSKGEQTRYQYDAFGRRILKASEGQQTRFYWLGDSLIKEQHTSAALGTQSTTYLFEPEQGNRESFKPVALVKSDLAHPQGMVYHIHTDHLGTPQEVSNEAGEVVWAAQYRAYGAVKRQLKVAGSDVNAADQPDPSLTMNLRFMGQYFDQETGLHYNRHRYYDPECGQFTSQDPIGLMGGLNNYKYVTNPVSWVDPLGLACKEICSNFSAYAKREALIREAVKANQSPWPLGFSPSIRRMRVGEQINMVVDSDQAAGLKGPGGFATFAHIPDKNFARQTLAITEQFKPDVSYVQKYEVIKDFDALHGPVGPQIDQVTGRLLPGSQYIEQLDLQLPWDKRVLFLKPVGPPMPIF